MATINNLNRFLNWYNENIGAEPVHSLVDELENLAMNGISFYIHEKTEKVYRFRTYFDYPTKKYNNLEEAIQKGDFTMEVNL